MLKSFKTELKPTAEQALTIRRTIGTCRFVYNLFIAENKQRHDAGEPFIGGMSFSVWLNHEYMPSNVDKVWIKDVSSKAVKQSIMNADAAFKKFFKKQSRFPRFKKKNRSDVKMYFVKNDAKTVIQCERHRIKISTLGWVRLKEYGYFPTAGSISSGTVSICAGRYYVSVLANVPDKNVVCASEQGVGVDLGVKELAVISDGRIVENINKTNTVKRLEKKLKREQKRLSRKYESLKQRNKKLKGEATRQNIQKQVLTVQKLHARLTNIRTNHVNQLVASLVKTKPAYITIEDLNVSGMMKNKHLSKAIAAQKFYEIRMKLQAKCKSNGIELRVVDRFCPSSKTCHNCGAIKHDLRLSNRTYECSCGYKADRDLNAALNLRDAKAYKLA